MLTPSSAFDSVMKIKRTPLASSRGPDLYEGAQLGVGELRRVHVWRVRVVVQQRLLERSVSAVHFGRACPSSGTATAAPPARMAPRAIDVISTLHPSPTAAAVQAIRARVTVSRNLIRVALKYGEQSPSV